MPLSQALRKLTEAGLLTALTPRPPPQPIPPQFRMDLHCAYHQGAWTFGALGQGQLNVTTNPLPAHTTHVVPPPADGIHFLDFVELMITFICLVRMIQTQSLLCQCVQTSFILIPDVEEVQAPRVDDSQTLDVHYILQ
ncbi:hypothetical protein CK203_031313 [Vitis vinifera]|uniref:Uncharacterized protein n=1 Tax=Vitis vinifera TaxID=29760 RepID=A0A438IXC2_VITVI|nr:hypothetical protein CK203_031313 [Vitis vinifera]